jgi:hypothetical protein
MPARIGDDRRSSTKLLEPGIAVLVHVDLIGFSEFDSVELSMALWNYSSGIGDLL